MHLSSLYVLNTQLSSFPPTSLKFCSVFFSCLSVFHCHQPRLLVALWSNFFRRAFCSNIELLGGLEEQTGKNGQQEKQQGSQSTAKSCPKIISSTKSAVIAADLECHSSQLHSMVWGQEAFAGAFILCLGCLSFLTFLLFCTLFSLSPNSKSRVGGLICQNYIKSSHSRCKRERKVSF